MDNFMLLFETFWVGRPVCFRGLRPGSLWHDATSVPCRIAIYLVHMLKPIVEIP